MYRVVIAIFILFVTNEYTLAQSIQPNTTVFVTVDDLIVVDSQGVTLGRAYLSEAVGSVNDVDVMLEVPDIQAIVRITVFSHGFSQTRVNIGYATVDCTGVAYLVSGDNQTLFALAAISGPGSTLYVAEVGVAPEGFVMQSVRKQATEEDPSECNSVLPQSAFGPQARALVDMASVYSPPFHLASATHVHRQTKRTFTGPALVRETE